MNVSGSLDQSNIAKVSGATLTIPSDAIISFLLQRRTYPDSFTFSPIFSIMNFFSKLAFFGLLVVALLSTDSGGVSARLLGGVDTDCVKACIEANKEIDRVDTAYDVYKCKADANSGKFKTVNECMHAARTHPGGSCRVFCAEP
jgi:hypothetical protein